MKIMFSYLAIISSILCIDGYMYDFEQPSFGYRSPIGVSNDIYNHDTFSAPMYPPSYYQHPRDHQRVAVSGRADSWHYQKEWFKDPACRRTGAKCYCKPEEGYTCGEWSNAVCVCEGGRGGNYFMHFG